MKYVKNNSVAKKKKRIRVLAVLGAILILSSLAGSIIYYL